MPDDLGLVEPATLDAEAMKKAAFAVFAKANSGNLPPDKIERLWPSQHHPHWDGLAEAAVRAYLDNAPQDAAIERLDHECQTSMATIASERARAEAAEARIERLLAERDEARKFSDDLADVYAGDLDVARTKRLKEALTQIVGCYDRNWQHQREKLDDIMPLARQALEDSKT